MTTRFKPGDLVDWHKSGVTIAARIVQLCDVIEAQGMDGAGVVPGAELEMMDPDFTKSASHIWRNEFSPLANLKPVEAQP